MHNWANSIPTRCITEEWRMNAHGTIPALLGRNQKRKYQIEADHEVAGIYEGRRLFQLN